MGLQINEGPFANFSSNFIFSHKLFVADQIFLILSKKQKQKKTDQIFLKEIF